jgi:hypothetical protein
MNLYLMLLSNAVFLILILLILLIISSRINGHSPKVKEDLDKIKKQIMD